MSAGPHEASEHRSSFDDPPRTGVPQVDEAVADLSELANAPLAEHHDRLARAHAALSAALSSPGTSPTEVAGGRDDPARP